MILSISCINVTPFWSCFLKFSEVGYKQQFVVGYAKRGRKRTAGKKVCKAGFLLLNTIANICQCAVVLCIPLSLFMFYWFFLQTQTQFFQIPFRVYFVWRATWAWTEIFWWWSRAPTFPCMYSQTLTGLQPVWIGEYMNEWIDPKEN